MSQYFVKESGTPLANIETITGNSGGAVGPDGAGNINVVGTGSITVAGNPGINTETIQLTGLTNHSLLVGAGTATITNLGIATDGQIPIGRTGMDPALSAITGSNNITITNGSGTIDVSQSNFYSASFTTVGAAFADLSISMGAVAGTKTFITNISGFESTTPASAGYQLIGTGRTDGATAVLVGATFTVAFGQTDAALAASAVSMSELGNDIIISVLGVAGLTINWMFEGTVVGVT